VDSDGVSENNKAVYTKFLKERCPLTIDPVFVDPEYIDLEVNTIATYNLNTLTISEKDLIAAVKSKLRLFNELNLNDFNTTFRYSKLVENIDSTSTSIISNSTEVTCYKALNPALNISTPFTVKFYNSLKQLNTAYAITSTFFTFRGVLCRLEDDGNGIVKVVSLELQNNQPTVAVNIGTVDYATGTVFIDGLDISSYVGPYIKMRAVTDLLDINASLNNIIRIRDEDINVTASGVRQ